VGTTQVFLGQGRGGQIVSAGTHADLVAVAGGIADELDIASLAQFLRHGYCVFPGTMYENLVESQPGTVQAICSEEDQLQPRQWSYWRTPAEARTDYSETDLAIGCARWFLAAAGGAVRGRPNRRGLERGPGFFGW
jgi:hypothetical protein